MLSFALLAATALLSTPAAPLGSEVSTLPAYRLTLMGGLNTSGLSQQVWSAKPAVIEVRVDPQGRVDHARVQATSGSMDLDRSALLAMRRAQFTGAQPGSRLRIPVTFALYGREVASR